MIIEAFALNTLDLTQSVDTNIKGFFIEHFLALSDSVDQNIETRGLQSLLTLRHTARVSKTIKVSASNSLTLTQQCNSRVWVESVNSFLFICSEAHVEPRFPAPHSSLALSQVAIVAVAKGCYSQLALTQSVTYTLTKNIHATSTLVIVSKASGYKPTKLFINGDFVVEAP